MHNPTGWVDPFGLAGGVGNKGDVKTKRPSDDLGEVTGHYSAVNPGPLDDGLAETFAGGRYKEVILSRDTEIYRAGVSTNEFGRFFSLDKPQSVIQTRIDKAVLPKWPNGGESPLDTVYKFTVPKGTKVYVGSKRFLSRRYRTNSHNSTLGCEGYENIRKRDVKMIQKIEKVLSEMSTLLDQNMETSWARYIDELLYRINIESDNTIIDIKALFGGMGSLNDLVLSKDGKPLAHENNKLDELRKELYKLCSPYK